MTIETAVEQLAEPIGREIGASSDRVQSDLLNGLCYMLDRTCHGHKLDTQISFFTSKLTPTARRVLRLVGEFCQEDA